MCVYIDICRDTELRWSSCFDPACLYFQKCSCPCAARARTHQGECEEADDHMVWVAQGRDSEYWAFHPGVCW